LANDELYTPKWIFDALGVTFDLDVASSANPYITVPTLNKFTIEDDALSQDWYGMVFMNPPFSKPKPWIAKWLDHGNGIALTPIGGNGKWLQDLWESDASCLVLKPNVGFINTENIEKKIMYRVGLWAIGKDAKQILKESGLGKVR
jgi:DNA N-6-adenine-methyltransferase (Dam)